MVNLSRLEEIKDLRTIWLHEALDFTPWLAQDDNALVNKNWTQILNITSV